MQAAVFTGIRGIAVREVTPPAAAGDDVVVAVRACGICGSDLHAYEHGRYVSPGQIMGHEISGVVAEIGSEIEDITVGERVAVMPYLSCGSCSACATGLPHLCAQITSNSIAYRLPGGFAEYVRVPRARAGINVHRLPDDLAFEVAALAEPLGVAIHAARMAGAYAPDGPMLVVGAGTIGLLTVAALRSLGRGTIVAVDLLDNRLAAAQTLGADLTVNPVRTPLKEALRQREIRPSAVIECSGAPTAIDDALHLLPPAGLVIAAALYASESSIDPSLVVRRELALRGSFASSQADFCDALALLGANGLPTESLISHRFVLSQAAKAFAAQADRGAAIKVMIVDQINEQESVR